MALVAVGASAGHYHPSSISIGRPRCDRGRSQRLEFQRPSHSCQRDSGGPLRWMGTPLPARGEAPPSTSFPSDRHRGRVPRYCCRLSRPPGSGQRPWCGRECGIVGMKRWLVLRGVVELRLAHLAAEELPPVGVGARACRRRSGAWVCVLGDGHGASSVESRARCDVRRTLDPAGHLARRLPGGRHRQDGAEEVARRGRSSCVRRRPSARRRAPTSPSRSARECDASRVRVSSKRRGAGATAPRPSSHSSRALCVCAHLEGTTARSGEVLALSFEHCECEIASGAAGDRAGGEP